jgi:hypothetical protein
MYLHDVQMVEGEMLYDLQTCSRRCIHPGFGLLT